MENYTSSDLSLQTTPPRLTATSPPRSYLQQDLQRQILRIIYENDKKQSLNHHLLAAITDNLEILCQNLQEDIHEKNTTEILKVRTHQLAINKILVLTHGKTDFRLIISHFQIGKAYLDQQCYEQAINHLTIASTKITRLSDIKQTKIYHAYILNALSTCYYHTHNYEHSLEILHRAQDIQNSNQNHKNSSVGRQTLEKLATCHLQLHNNKEAAKIIDKLIDIINTQLAEMESFHKKMNAILNASNERAQLQSSYREVFTTKTGTLRSRNNSNIQMFKILQFLYEKLDFLIIEYDKVTLRDLLSTLIKEQDPYKSPLLDALTASLTLILTTLTEELKKQKIFKFTVFLNEPTLNSALDQQLKSFIKQYEDEKEVPDSFKRLTLTQTIETYRLAILYSERLADQQNQMVYLKKLEELYLQDPSLEGKINLLKVKRNLSLLYNHRQTHKKVQETLDQVRNLQLELYGEGSEAVRRTTRMIKMARLGGSKENDQELDKKSSKDTKQPNKLKFNKPIGNSTSSQSVQGKVSNNRLVL